MASKVQDRAGTGLFSRISRFSCVAGIFFLLLLLPGWYVSYEANRSQASFGFQVFTMPRPPIMGKDLWTSGLVVRLDAKNQLYLNNETVSQEKLLEELSQAFARRPGTIVYFSADSHVRYQEAITAMDAIRTL